MEDDAITFIVSCIINLMLIIFVFMLNNYEASEEKLIMFNICVTQSFFALTTFSGLIVSSYIDIFSMKLRELHQEVKYVIDLTMVLELGITFIIFSIYYFSRVLVKGKMERSTIKMMLVVSWLTSIILGVSNNKCMDMGSASDVVFTTVGMQITLMVIVMFHRLLISESKLELELTRPIQYINGNIDKDVKVELI